MAIGTSSLRTVKTIADPDSDDPGARFAGMPTQLQLYPGGVGEIAKWGGNPARRDRGTPAFKVLLLRSRRWVLFVLCAVLGACETPGVIVTGHKSTASAAQSETAATTSYVSNVSRIVVTFNDETGTSGTIQYGPTSRKVLSGASLMGWAHSDDEGISWHYGGKLAPPKGWSVLWGDPALTTSGAHYNIVFLSNFAVPASKYPAGGINGYLYYGGGRSAYIGGACIAKSTDGGKSFSNHRCISNTQPIDGIPDTPQGHFYDGASLASSPTGEVFAAYADITTSQIDVWRAADENASFQQLPPPFPGMVIGSHPRLRVGPDGSLYVAAMAKTNNGGFLVYMNRYTAGAWSKPVTASNPAVGYPDIDLSSTVQGAPLIIRTAAQFSFDIGAASEDGTDAIRLLYTRQDGPNAPLYIDASKCRADLSKCYPAPGWKVGPSGPAETRLRPI